MKVLLASLLLSMLYIGTYAQTITYEAFTSLIPLVHDEQYKETFAKTKKMLGDAPHDSSDLRAIVAYMNIYSAAGMVSQGEMQPKDFDRVAHSYIGQRLVLPAHPCIDTMHKAYNSLTLKMNDGRTEGFTVASNHDNTTILLFEYINYAETIYPLEMIGENVRSGGTLDSVESNDHKGLWVGRLHIGHAFARKAD